MKAYYVLYENKRDEWLYNDNTWNKSNSRTCKQLETLNPHTNIIESNLIELYNENVIDRNRLKVFHTMKAAEEWLENYLNSSYDYFYSIRKIWM